MALVTRSWCCECNSEANKINGVLSCQHCDSKKHKEALVEFIKQKESMTLEERIRVIERSMFERSYRRN